MYPQTFSCIVFSKSEKGLSISIFKLLSTTSFLGVLYKKKFILGCKVSNSFFSKFGNYAFLWNVLTLALLSWVEKLFPYAFHISANKVMCDIICPPNTSYNVVPCNMIVIFFPAASNNVLIPLAFADWRPYCRNNRYLLFLWRQNILNFSAPHFHIQCQFHVHFSINTAPSVQYCTLT